MKNEKSLFIGIYTDGYDNNFLVFVADKKQDELKEFKKVYRAEYGEKFNSDIIGVYSINEAFDYKTKKDYKIKLI